MSHDLVVLAISDGVLFVSTGFGFLLQKLIYSGVISWNKQGWIIQSVSFMILPKTDKLNLPLRVNLAPIVSYNVLQPAENLRMLSVAYISLVI